MSGREIRSCCNSCRATASLGFFPAGSVLTLPAPRGLCFTCARRTKRRRDGGGSGHAVRPADRSRQHPCPGGRGCDGALYLGAGLSCRRSRRPTSIPQDLDAPKPAPQVEVAASRPAARPRPGPRRTPAAPASAPARPVNIEATDPKRPERLALIALMALFVVAGLFLGLSRTSAAALCADRRPTYQ